MKRGLTLGLLVLIAMSGCDKGPKGAQPPGNLVDGGSPVMDMAVAPSDMGRPMMNRDAGLMSDATAPDMLVRTGAPIFITTMTHLEGNWNYDGDMGRRKFDLDVSKIRQALATFSAHGAKLTIESEIPFAEAELEFGSGIFDELLDAGHGVATHCDIRPTAPRVDAEEYAEAFIQRKLAVDTLIGAEENLGCSGGQGRSDWVLGAHYAGFRYLDGTVAYGFLSMPEANRPEGWTDEYIIDEGHFHDNIPLELVDRIHPYMMADATDMVPDPDDGVILLSSGGMGRLDAQTETATGTPCRPRCTYDDEDVDYAIEAIEAALAVHDSTRVGKIDFYFPLSNFREGNQRYIEAFLERVDREYIQTGRLQWATQKDLYEAFVEWNLAL